MAEVIDLNVLVPESRIVKIGDKEIEIKPPKTAQMFKLGALGQKMQGADKIPAEQMEALVKEMTDLIVEIVPDIEGIELHPTQVFKLIEIIGVMVNGDQTESPKVG